MKEASAVNKLLLPPDLTGPASITFNSQNRMVMRIDKDGRLHAGPDLSNEEASRALFEVCRQTFDAEWTRRERRIDELERENAALLEDKAHLREELREANRLLVAFGPESARAARAAEKTPVGADAIMRQHLREGGTPT
jgi:hypothetical protein